MNTGHDDFHDDHGRDRERAAQRFADEHPELAREMDEAAVQAMVAESTREVVRETAIGTAFIAALFVLLLAGRVWWDWGAWSLVALGAAGLITVSGAIELALFRIAPVALALRRREERP